MNRSLPHCPKSNSQKTHPDRLVIEYHDADSTSINHPRRLLFRSSLASGLLLVSLCIRSRLGGLLLFLLANHQPNDTSLGNPERAGPFDPLLIGLHLGDPFGSRQYAADPCQTTATLQTLIDRHVDPLPSRKSGPPSRSDSQLTINGPPTGGSGFKLPLSIPSANPRNGRGGMVVTDSTRCKLP